MNTSALLASLAAFWLGGLCALDLIETPAKFRLASMPRGPAVELGRIVFRRFGTLELVVAAVMAALVGHGNVPQAAAVCCGLLAGLTILTALLIRPQLDARTRTWLEQTAAEKREATGLKSFHRLYVMVDLAKLALLIAVIVLVVR